MQNHEKNKITDSCFSSRITRKQRVSVANQLESIDFLNYCHLNLFESFRHEEYADDYVFSETDKYLFAYKRLNDIAPDLGLVIPESCSWEALTEKSDDELLTGLFRGLAEISATCGIEIGTEDFIVSATRWAEKVNTAELREFITQLGVINLSQNAFSNIAADIFLSGNSTYLLNNNLNRKEIISKLHQDTCSFHKYDNSSADNVIFRLLMSSDGDGSDLLSCPFYHRDALLFISQREVDAGYNIYAFAKDRLAASFVRLSLLLVGERNFTVSDSFSMLSEFIKDLESQATPAKFNIIQYPLNETLPTDIFEGSIEIQIDNESVTVTGDNPLYSYLALRNLLKPNGRMAVNFSDDFLRRCDGVTERFRKYLIESDSLVSVNKSMLVFNSAMRSAKSIMFLGYIGISAVIERDKVIDNSSVLSSDIYTVVFDNSFKEIAKKIGEFDLITLSNLKYFKHHVTDNFHDWRYDYDRYDSITGVGLSWSELSIPGVVYSELSHISDRNPLDQEAVIVKYTKHDYETAVFKPNEEHKSVTLDSNIHAIVCDQNLVLSDYLYVLLNSIVWVQYNELMESGLSEWDHFKSLVVPIPRDISIQKKYLENRRRRILAKQRRERQANANPDSVNEQIKRSEYEVVRHIAHNISPRISSVAAIIRHLEKFLDRSGMLDSPLQEQFYEGQETKRVGSAIETARADIRSVESLIRDTRKVITEKIDGKDFEIINLKTFVKDEIQPRYEHRNFKFEATVGDDIDVELHRSSFLEFIDNLVRNAEQHGFSGRVAGNLVRFHAYGTKSALVIDLWNNGEPLPAGFSKDSYFSFGVKAQDSKGEGLGGAYICKVLDAHRASMKLLPKNKEFPVRFRFTFPCRRKHK